MDNGQENEKYYIVIGYTLGLYIYICVCIVYIHIYIYTHRNIYIYIGYVMYGDSSCDWLLLMMGNL